MADAENEAGKGLDASAGLADENALLRASLAETRERLVSHAGRHGTPAALLYIDLDNLKAINDRHGHFAGDAALIHVARLLGGLIRSTDILARIGGDEFGLILDHLDHNSAIETADRLARCIAAEPLDLGSAMVTLEASIGTATILAGDSVDDVMRRADRNMYAAKAER